MPKFPRAEKPSASERVPLYLDRPVFVIWVVWAGGPVPASMLAIYAATRTGDDNLWRWLGTGILLAFPVAQLLTGLGMLALILSRCLRDTAEFWLLVGYWVAVPILAALVMMDVYRVADVYRTWMLGVSGAWALVIAVAVPLCALRRSMRAAGGLPAERDDDG